MQRLKKNFVMLLGICLFSSCAGVPKKPIIDICGHDQPNFKAECYNNQTQEYKEIDINDTDRYIMFSPDDWGLILIYIKKLERRIRSRKVKREINKVIKADISLKKRLME